MGDWIDRIAVRVRRVAKARGFLAWQEASIVRLNAHVVRIQTDTKQLDIVTDARFDDRAAFDTAVEEEEAACFRDRCEPAGQEINRAEPKDS